MISNCFQVAFEKKSFKAFILIYSPKHNSSKIIIHKMFIAKVSKNVCIFVLIRYPHWPSPHDYKLNYTKPVTMIK
jgi:hypothetical protein